MSVSRHGLTPVRPAGLPLRRRRPSVGVVAGAAHRVAFAPDTVPLGVVVLGALLGTGTGLLAVGLVLTYRSHRVVNFALGGIGGLGAGLAVGLHLGQGWPWPVAIVVGLATGLAGRGAHRAGRAAPAGPVPRLVVTVATIGLAQLFAAGQAALPVAARRPRAGRRLRDAAVRVHASTSTRC